MNQNTIDQKVEKLLKVMKRLRQECPWDAKQTHHSLKPYLLEEAYEVLETIDFENWKSLPSELGDLLLQIVFHSEIASEAGCFKFEDVVDHITAKLIERHPHVFGDKEVHGSEQVQENWEHTKVISENRNSILSGIPKTAPALLQAQRLQEKAATVGFDWSEIEPVIHKIEEEIGELKDAITEGNLQLAKGELGDLIFGIVNMSRFMKINAEDALRMTNEKFVKRFQYIEQKYDKQPSEMKKASLEELDSYWNEAKNKV